MICKYYLAIGGTRSEVSRCDLKNWDEVEYSVKRSDFGGVVRSFSSSFEFVGDAADLITAEFARRHLYASAEIEVCTQQDNLTFAPAFSCPLDFSSYMNENGVVSINAIDNSLAAIIKSKKSKKYEFLMSEMPLTDKRKPPFVYEGIEISNAVSYELGYKNPETLVRSFTFMPTEGNQKIPVTSVEDDVKEQKGMEWRQQVAEGFKILTDEELKKRGAIYGDHLPYPYGAETDGSNVMMANTSNETIVVEVHLDITFSLSPNFTTDDFELWMSTAIGWESEEQHDGNVYNMYDRGEVQYRQIKSQNGKPQYVADIGFSMYPGQKLLMFARLKKQQQATLDVVSCKFDVVWKTKTPTNRLDYVRPIDLLKKIVESMTEDKVAEGETSPYECAIESKGRSSKFNPDDFSMIGSSGWDARIDHTILLPKDAISRNPKEFCYIKTSFSDFCKWMEVVFGFVYTIEGTKITFKHRDRLFGGRITKYIDYVDDASYKVNKKLVFSTVEVGYKNKEDGYNSRFEFNKSYEYDTGIDNTEKKLSLLSPYRADSIGFELAYEKGVVTHNEDKSSEDGIWCVYVDDTDEHGQFLDQIKVRKTSVVHYDFRNLGLFNVYLSPIYCLKANSRYISSFVEKLRLVTKEINDIHFFADFGLLKMKRDFSKVGDDCKFYDTQLFSVGEFNFSTNDQTLPVNIYEPIKVRWYDKVVIGCVKEISSKYERAESSDYTLIVKNIESI